MTDSELVEGGTAERNFSMLEVSTPQAPARSPSKSVGRWFLFALLGWVTIWTVVMFVLFHPGLMSNDSLAQLYEGITGEFTNAHPPLFALLLRVSFSISSSVWPVLLVQVAALGVGIALLASRQLHPAQAFAFTLLVTLCPPIWAILPTIWTDVFSVVALIWAVVSLAHRSRVWALIFLELATLIRHNAILASAPLLLLVVVSFPELRPSRWRKPVYVVLGLLVFMFSPKVVERLMQTSDVWLLGWIMADDLAGFYAEKPAEFVNSTFASETSAAELAQLYSRHTAVPLLILAPSRGLRGIDRSTLASRKHAVATEWLKMVVTEPFLYLKIRLRRSCTMLGLYPEPVYYPFHSTIDNNSYGLKLTSHTIAFRTMRKIETAVQNTILFRGWFGLILLLGVTAYALVRKGAMAVGFWVGVSGLVYMLGNFLFAPAADFRYLFWPIVSMFLAFATLSCRLNQAPATRGADDRERELSATRKLSS